MPKFTFLCEVCGKEATKYRMKEKPPRFCSEACRNVGLYGRPFRPVKWVITPEMHDRIQAAYLNYTGNGEINALSQVLKLPRWKISRYAVSHGWIAKQRKEPNWTEAELHILEQSAHLSLVIIQKRLKKKGFSRSEMGILLKRKRMRFLKNLKGQSARSVAECFGVTEKTIRGWIKNGWLAGDRRRTGRTETQGGDMFFIKDKAIRDFIISSVEVIDFRKIDKYWLVSLLTDESI